VVAVGEGEDTEEAAEEDDKEAFAVFVGSKGIEEV